MWGTGAHGHRNAGGVAFLSTNSYLCDMSHVRLFYHIVFVTKYRKDTIPEQHERKLYKYILEVCHSLRVKLIRVNSTPSHVHILVSFPATLTVADFMRDVKRSTSLMMKRTPGFEQFIGWAREYSCNTVSFHQVEPVKNYIIRQKEHHKTVDLADELKSIFNQDVDESTFA